jgi:hypothetical protein
MDDKIKAGKKLAFDEFKLFYDSTEKVTDRRISANRWNYSICIAILVAVAGIINWGLSKPNFLIITVIAVTFLCIMATLFCSLWIGQIRDFKALNNAKFDVLNKMAPNIVFGDSQTDPRVSYSPFEREWKVLRDSKAVKEISDSKIIALKASNIEYMVPKAFRILFIAIFIFVSAFSILNWEKMINPLTLVVKESTKEN